MARLHMTHRMLRHTLASVILGTLSLATAGSAPAQKPTPTSSGRLVLGDLYRDAERANPRSDAARALARAADARISWAGLPPDPVVQLGFMNYTLPSLAPMEPIGMTQLQVMQMLPLGGKLGLSRRVARAQASAIEARAADIGWEVRSEAAMGFYDLYATEQALAVARETLRVLQDIARTTEAMYRVGEGRQADVLRAQVEIARMTEDTVRMQAMRTTMVARLLALLDKPQAMTIASPAIPEFPTALPSRDTLERLARDYRPMLRAGERELEAAQAGERLTHRELWPDLQLGVQLGRRGGEMGTEWMGSLMVGASVPVFARSRQFRMRDEAAAMTAMAAADLRAMQADTRGQLGEAYANLRRSRNLTNLYRATVIPQAEATVSSALAAYRVGSVDFMTLLDNRMSVNRYRQELHALEAEEGKAWAELEMLTGQQLVDPFTMAPRGAGGTR
jgi:outer membrane protein TolC